MKKLTYFAVATAFTFLAGGWISSYAQETLDLDDIDTIMEDNTLNETAKRYSSVLLSFYPERATRIGVNAANSQLNRRESQQSAFALAALRSVQHLLDEVDEKNLSAAKKAERALLEKDLQAAIWQEEQNRVTQDPLYYAQALDAIYDVYLKQMASRLRQRADLEERIKALPSVAALAEKNLANPAPFLAQQAMEKAYYAYLSLDEITEFLLEAAEDDITSNQIKREMLEAKRAARKMFDLFKTFSQEENSTDFRLGEDNYSAVLTNFYSVNDTPSKVVKNLSAKVTQTQRQLSLTLDPFLQAAETDEVTIIDGNGETPATPVKKPAKKKKRKGLIIRNGQDFYAVAKQVIENASAPDPIPTLKADAQHLERFFNQTGALPAQNILFVVSPMPQYYSYTRAYLFVPPYGDQVSSKTDFFLRVPSGNTLSRKEQTQRDFNEPTRKLMLSGELVPGRYYQARATENISFIRRWYPSETMANGWSMYAKRLAKEKGYIYKDEELLFLAWDEYKHALAAFVDAKLHLRQFSYSDALSFLTQEHGVDQAEAEDMLKSSAVYPGKAVSYWVGLDALEQVRDHYRHKQGKKFNEADFHAKLFQVGNVLPDWLQREMERLYQKDRKAAKKKKKKEDDFFQGLINY